MIKQTLLACSLSTLFLAGAANAELIIDDFSVDQAKIEVNGVGSLSTSVTGPDSVLMGEERDILVDVTSVANNNLGASAFVGSGFLSVSVDTLTSATVSVQYDGTDNSPNINTAGLGSRNFALNGSGFLFEVLSQDLDLGIRINTWWGGGASTNSANLVTTSSAPGVVYIDFSDPIFGGTDFTDISALEFIFNPDGESKAYDVSYGMVSVPEPASMFLFGAGLLGFAGMKRRKQ